MSARQYTAKSRVTDLKRLRNVILEWQTASERVGLCHGCFDPMHIGHIWHFEEAASYVDRLVVTVTPDRFVNKGAGRPVVPEHHRAETIAATRVVDLVALNAWPRAVETLGMLRPDLFFKGPDYRNNSGNPGYLAEKHEADTLGIGVVVTTSKKLSSTGLISHSNSMNNNALQSVPADSALIFDLDGVLVETMPAHLEAWKAIARELDLPVGEIDFEGFRGRSRVDCLSTLEAKTGGLTDGMRSLLLDKKQRLYLDLLYRSGSSIVVPGIKDLLMTLREHGYAVALASASRNASAILEQAGLTNCFDATSDGTFDGPPKPQPDQVLDVLKRLDADPGRSVVFDDSFAGLRAADAAGCATFGIGSYVACYPSLSYFLPTLEGVSAVDLALKLQAQLMRPPALLNADHLLTKAENTN